MLRKTLYLAILVGLVSFAVILVIIAPYHIYTLALTEGVNTRFLVMKPINKILYDGNEFPKYSNKNSYFNDSYIYKTFHFSNFEIPFPVNNPAIVMIPTIKVESSVPYLGINILNTKNTELFSFSIEKNSKFEMSSGEQRIFSLPLFRNYIKKKNDKELWKDLFSKKLSLPSNEGRSFLDSLLNLRTVSYNDLVYNMYIYYNRSLFFTDNIKNIFFDMNSELGLVDFVSPNEKYRIEKLYLISEGIIYSINIKTKINDILGEFYRLKFINEVKYKNSTPDSAIPIYAEYKNLPYLKRIDQQGMISLFSAWSHDLDNREFVRVIILFLERGHSNLKYLKPFYEYAYKQFGSNLSGSTEVLLETADEKLKRKVKEDLETEVKTEASKKLNSTEGNFNSPDEKIKFYLKKAKENKNNSDDSEKILIQD